MTNETLTTITNNIIIPCIQFGFPVAILFTLTEKIINFILSCIRGDKKVNL